MTGTLTFNKNGYLQLNLNPVVVTTFMTDNAFATNPARLDGFAMQNYSLLSSSNDFDNVVKIYRFE